MTEGRANTLLAACRERQIMLCTAESCTGGLLSAEITAIPGSSDVFDRGFVTYSYGAKEDLLDVAPELLAEHGAVSEPVAAAMLKGALAHSDATLALAITGVAGPGGSEAKPEGMVCFGVGLKGGAMHAETVQFGPLGRAEVREKSVEHALRLGLAALGESV